MRHKNDAYYTNSKLVYPALNLLNASPKTILEPCAGTGMISSAVGAEYNKSVTTNDIEDHAGLTYIGDALDKHHPMYDHTYDLVITNPPYNIIDELLPLFWEASSQYLAILARLSILEPTRNRRDILFEMAPHITHIAPVNPRPKFIPGKGSDSVTHIWLIADKSIYNFDPIYTPIIDWR